MQIWGPGPRVWGFAGPVFEGLKVQGLGLFKVQSLELFKVQGLVFFKVQGLVFFKVQGLGFFKVQPGLEGTQRI